MRKKKKGFWKPAAAGFSVMYLVTMVLATGLVKERFVQEDALRFEGGALAILDQASEKEFAMENEASGGQGLAGEQETMAGGRGTIDGKRVLDGRTSPWDGKERQGFYQDLVNDSFWRMESKHMQVSIAAYDKDKELLAKSRDEIGGNLMRAASTRESDYASFALDDYLSLEEKETLAKYQAEDIRYCQETDMAEKYRFSIRVSPDLKELWEIYVQEIIWEEDKEGEEEGEEAYLDPLTGGVHFMSGKVMIDYASGKEMVEVKNYHEAKGEVVWKWTNPAADEKKLADGELVNTELTLPYLSLYHGGTYAQWRRWAKSGYLQGFLEQGKFSWEEGGDTLPLMIEEDGICRRGKMQLQIGMVDAPFSYLEIRMESRPWYAAVDYMKYVYLAGAVLTVLCMLAVIGMMDKVYERQAVLEETRRDFTNAMAHELKTPLGVIRNFAENLLEHHKEEKRDYYLAQIIGQTEEMDRLVREMIEVSKLDSEKLVLGREEVSLLALTQEQVKRFAPIIEEKKQQIEFSVRENEDFLVQGDKEYLAKAVWNLLSNGIDYSPEGGKIFIQMDKEQCIIENSGEPMDKEALLHAFDLFYTGDKSRRAGDGHMGMGLYLAKKIFELHQLKLLLENTDGGVRAVICRR